MKKYLEKLESFLNLGGIKKDIIFLIIGGISLLIGLFKLNIFPFNMSWIAIMLCGLPILLEAIIGLVTRFDIKADVLVSLALIASICIGEYFAAGEVAFIMQLGALLEDLTVAKARAGIEKLVRLTPQTARVVSNGREVIISAEKVKVGDILRVLPGETIPADGIILSGETSVNQAVMTGESLPVDKTIGDEVFSGTVNQFGTFEMNASKVGEDSSIQRMIRLVKSADADKAKIVRLADKWATWVVIIALTSAVLTWVISGEIIRAVTILVVFCPCSLVLATPTAIMAAIGNATKHGFLVREGDALERLAKVTKICFDKTGTLTYGIPKVMDVKSISDYSEREIYALTAAAEQYSEHPLGKAIIRCFVEKGGKLLTAEQFKMTAGRGVSANVNGKNVIAGNLQFLNENIIAVTENILNETKQFLSQGCTIIYTAVDGRLEGYLALADSVREESNTMISQIKEIGVQPTLLTGDDVNAANSIAVQLNISEVKSNCLPEEKLKHIENFQQIGESVCMIGDGINDAPALKKSNVGIAMGA